MRGERCYCGDPLCPSCGRAIGTYPEPPEPDPDEAYDRAVQDALDAPPAPETAPDPAPTQG